MPNINDLDHQTRRCDSKSVRASCAFERGQETLSDHTWARYRQICKVPPRIQTLTYREAMLLLVCAALHKAGHQRVSYLQTVAEANKRLGSDVGEMAIARLSKTCGAEARILGRDLPQVIYDLTQRRISERTLYRWGSKPGLPRYERDREYTPREVRRWLKAIA